MQSHHTNPQLKSLKVERIFVAGAPWKGPTWSRPTLGGKELPFPRRLRSNRPTWIDPETGETTDFETAVKEDSNPILRALVVSAMSRNCASMRKERSNPSSWSLHYSSFREHGQSSCCAYGIVYANLCTWRPGNTLRAHTYHMHDHEMHDSVSTCRRIAPCLRPMATGIEGDTQSLSMQELPPNCPYLPLDEQWNNTKERGFIGSAGASVLGLALAHIKTLAEDWSDANKSFVSLHAVDSMYQNSQLPPESSTLSEVPHVSLLCWSRPAWGYMHMHVPAAHLQCHPALQILLFFNEVSGKSGTCAHCNSGKLHSHVYQTPCGRHLSC